MNNDRGIISNIFNRLNPFEAPELYSRHFGGHQDSIDLIDKSGALIRYDLISSLNDAKTGFRADVMLDKASGHAVILYKGMDVPFKDEGNGRLAFLKDIKTAAQAIWNGGPNNQTPLAEQIYQETLNNPDVSSIEAVGFSLGTLHANHVAAKYGINAYVSSDLGYADRGLKKIFNTAAEVTTASNSLKNNVTVFKMDMDLVPVLFNAGPHRGQVIDLDEGEAPDLSGILHLIRIYSQKSHAFAARMIPPTVVATPAPGPAPA